MSDKTTEDIMAAFTNHRKTLTEIARSVGVDESALPEDPGEKAQRAAFFGDRASAKAHEKEAEKSNDLARDVQDSMELAELIAAEVDTGRSKRSGTRVESDQATAFREMLRGGQ